MNTKLVEIANAAITDPSFEEAPGYCCRFVRQCVERAYELKYAGLFKASARETGYAFLGAGYGRMVALGREPQPGDILIKTPLPFGHIGILVEGGKVAENSSTHIGRVQGAKGYRDLADFGPYSIVGALPDQPTHYDLIFCGNHLCAMPESNGVCEAPVRIVAQAVGADLAYENGVVLVDGKPLTDVLFQDGHAVAPIRSLAEHLGLQLSFSTTTREVTLL